MGGGGMFRSNSCRVEPIKLSGAWLVILQIIHRAL